eukprot:9671912-Alexandrium_andersonii.AAC.1
MRKESGARDTLEDKAGDEPEGVLRTSRTTPVCFPHGPIPDAIALKGPTKSRCLLLSLIHI